MDAVCSSLKNFGFDALTVADSYCHTALKSSLTRGRALGLAYTRLNSKLLLLALLSVFASGNLFEETVGFRQTARVF